MPMGAGNSGEGDAGIRPHSGVVKSTRLSLLLFGGGVVATMFALFWSLYAYGLVGGLVASKGLRPNQVFMCLFGPFERCTPLPFTDSLCGAIAGRPFIFRFVDAQPM